MQKRKRTKILNILIVVGIVCVLFSSNSNDIVKLTSVILGGLLIVVSLVLKLVDDIKNGKTAAVEESLLNDDVCEIDLSPLPIQVEYIKTNEPSERQLAYARDLGIEVLDSHCSADVSDMISRFEDEDFDKPPLALAQYALDIGAEITPYIGANALIGAILHKLSTHERIAFYAYAVYCSALGKDLGSLKESQYYEKFVEFGISKVDDTRFLKSIENRPNSDYYNPNRNTVAYSAVLELTKTF